MTAHYFSPSTGGFYYPAIHGARLLTRTSTAPDTGEVIESWTEANPACLIPGDAVEISAAHYAALMQAQSEGKEIVADGSGHPVAVEPPALDLTAYLAQRRWQAEVGGTFWHGWNLPTDERSQGKYQAELLAATAGARHDGDPWKFPHGFEALTNDQVRDMAFAARAHILACYAKEAVLLNDIAQGMITTTAEIDAAFAALTA